MRTQWKSIVSKIAVRDARHSRVASNIRSCKRPGSARLELTLDLAGHLPELSLDGSKIVCRTSHITCLPVEMRGGKLEQLLDVLGAIEFIDAIWRV
jgi:hypothetical protein